MNNLILKEIKIKLHNGSSFLVDFLSLRGGTEFYRIRLNKDTIKRVDLNLEKLKYANTTLIKNLEHIDSINKPEWFKLNKTIFLQINGANSAKRLVFLDTNLYNYDNQVKLIFITEDDTHEQYMKLSDYIALLKMNVKFREYRNEKFYTIQNEFLSKTYLLLNKDYTSIFKNI